MRSVTVIRRNWVRGLARCLSIAEPTTRTHKQNKGERTTLLTPSLKPWQALFLVQRNTEPTPYSASLKLPAEMLVVAVIGTHGNSNAAMVPAGVNGCVTVDALTMVQRASV